MRHKSMNGGLEPESAIMRHRAGGANGDLFVIRADLVEKQGLRELRSAMKAVEQMRYGEKTLAHLKLRAQTRKKNENRRAAILVL